MRVPIPEDHGGRAAYLAERATTLRDIQCRSTLTRTTRARCETRSVLRHQPLGVTSAARAECAGPVRQMTISVVGAHGGAGTSTVARLLNATDSGRLWPDPGQPGCSPRVVLTARTNAVGLMAASQALAGYFASSHPEGPYLAGFVLVPDAPGRVPRELNRRIAILASATMVYRLPWVRSWRLCETTPDQVMAARLAPGLLQFVEQAAVAAVPAPRESSHASRGGNDDAHVSAFRP
jgi:hypothetical protein